MLMYPVEIRDILDGTVDVRIQELGLAKNQTERLLVPILQVPERVLDIWKKDNTVQFFISTDTPFSPGKWKWVYDSELPPRVDQKDQVEVIDTREEFTFLINPTKTYETVNHPPHYDWHSKVECIDVIEEFESVNVAFAIKHLWRLGHKPNISMVEDLDKAIWYLQREKQRLSERD